jgi:multidrug efflux pump subunit AcrA (membrane-fusion protein)
MLNGFVNEQIHANSAQDRAQAGKTELNVKRHPSFAQVKADEAAVENAHLNLGFTQLNRPLRDFFEPLIFRRNVFSRPPL